MHKRHRPTIHIIVRLSGNAALIAQERALARRHGLSLSELITLRLRRRLSHAITARLPSLRNRPFHLPMRAARRRLRRILDYAQVHRRPYLLSGGSAPCGDRRLIRGRRLDGPATFGFRRRVVLLPLAGVRASRRPVRRRG